MTDKIYLIMHLVEDNEEMLEHHIIAEKGYIWYAYTNKEEAEQEAVNLNNNIMVNNRLHRRFIVIERTIY